MDFTIKSWLLYAAVTLTGLSAGLFYAWSVSVIPGTQKVVDATYLETMQAINRAILNPAFYLVFFGSVILLGLSVVYQYQNGATFWLVLLAAVLYLVGTFGVTAFGNVPLNDQLDVLDLVEFSPAKLQQFRDYYETKWNRLHTIRTVFAVASFMCSLLAVFTAMKS